MNRTLVILAAVLVAVLAGTFAPSSVAFAAGLGAAPTAGAPDACSAPRPEETGPEAVSQMPGTSGACDPGPDPAVPVVPADPAVPGAEVPEGGSGEEPVTDPPLSGPDAPDADAPDGGGPAPEADLDIEPGPDLDVEPGPGPGLDPGVEAEPGDEGPVDPAVSVPEEQVPDETVPGAADPDEAVTGADAPDRSTEGKQATASSPDRRTTESSSTTTERGVRASGGRTDEHRHEATDRSARPGFSRQAAGPVAATEVPASTTPAASTSDADPGTLLVIGAVLAAVLLVRGRRDQLL